jgi:hypothetical protein
MSLDIDKLREASAKILVQIEIPPLETPRLALTPHERSQALIGRQFFPSPKMTAQCGPNEGAFNLMPHWCPARGRTLKIASKSLKSGGRTRART